MPTIQQLTEANNPLSLAALFYTDACQSHLDLGSNDGRTLRGLDHSIITCVELFEPSIAKLKGQGQGFEGVFQADIRAFVADMVMAHSGPDAWGPDEWHTWDRVTAFDVIEHIPREDGERLLDQLEQIVGREIILFMPIETPELEATARWQQYREDGLSVHPHDQRDLHDHRSQWGPDDLAKRGYITMVLPNFHYEGFGAFFAAKYVDPADREAAIGRVQAFAQAQMPPEQRFGHLGQGSRVDRPVFVGGPEHIYVGDGVSIGFGARIECISQYNEETFEPTLVIGDLTTAEFFLHIGCAQSVIIGRQCMLAGHVSLSDHEHSYSPDRPLHGQPLTVAPVRLGDHVFVGEYSWIAPGVTIGDHAVIGAHSVVAKDIPAYAVVAGVPARVIRYLKGGEE